MTYEYIKENAEYFKSLLRKTNRDNIEKLIQFLDENQFFSVIVRPEEGNSIPGNLITHSLSVYEAARKINLIFNMNLSQTSLIIVCLLHDLCFVDINNKLPVGHSEKSIFIAQRYIHLTDEEIIAINSHMGSADLRMSDYNGFGCAWDLCPLALCLYLADTLSACYLEHSV